MHYDDQQSSQVACITVQTLGPRFQDLDYRPRHQLGPRFQDLDSRIQTLARTQTPGPRLQDLDSRTQILGPEPVSTHGCKKMLSCTNFSKCLPYPYISIYHLTDVNTFETHRYSIMGILSICIMNQMYPLLKYSTTTGV